MARVCGPMVGFRGEVDGAWRLTIMVAHQGDEADYYTYFNHLLISFSAIWRGDFFKNECKYLMSNGIFL